MSISYAMSASMIILLSDMLGSVSQAYQETGVMNIEICGSNLIVIKVGTYIISRLYIYLTSHILCTLPINFDHDTVLLVGRENKNEEKN